MAGLVAHSSAMDTDPPALVASSAGGSPWAVVSALQASYPREDLSAFIVGPVREDDAAHADAPSDGEDAGAPSDEECSVIVLDPEEVDRRRKLRRIGQPRAEAGARPPERVPERPRNSKPRGERESGERARGRGRGRGRPPGRGRYSRGRGS